MLSARSARLRIFDLQGQKVILDCDLAAYYVVTLARLNSACRLGAKGFTKNSRFRLTQREYAKFRSQHGDSTRDPRGLPYAFTARGAIVAAKLLGTPAALFMSGTIGKAFRKTPRSAQKTASVSSTEMRRARDWLENQLEDRLQMTNNFKGRIESSERQMAEGQRPRTRSGPA